MRITIFSLGGVLGQAVTNAALHRGDQVTIYVPDAKAVWPRKNLTVMEGSLQNRERVMEALLEADTVISVLVPVEEMVKMKGKTPLADGNAMILSAMKQLGKTRFVTVGHVCIRAEGDCEDRYQKVAAAIEKLFWPKIYEDMQKMGKILSGCDLNWTLVRACPDRGKRQKKQETGCRVSLDGSTFHPGINEVQLADFLYQAAVDQNFYSRKMPILYSKK